MKYVALILTLLAAACLIGPLRAQPARPDAAGRGPTPQAPAAIKIGVVDLGVLFRQQDRVKDLKKELDVRVKPFEVKRDELGKSISELHKALLDKSGKLSDDQRFKGEQRILECSRQLQDLDRKYHDEIGEHLGAEMVALDREVRQTIKVYAELHGYQLILAYGNDPDGEAAPLKNVLRLMLAIDSGNLSHIMPDRSSGMVDVTRGVLDLLNSSYRAGNGLPRK